jgi:hypothetical protein
MKKSFILIALIGLFTVNIGFSQTTKDQYIYKWSDTLKKAGDSIKYFYVPVTITAPYDFTLQLVADSVAGSTDATAYMQQNALLTNGSVFTNLSGKTLTIDGVQSSTILIGTLFTGKIRIKWIKGTDTAQLTRIRATLTLQKSVLANATSSPIGAVTGVTTISNSGRITGTGGVTITGAASNINASSNYATNIGTGSSTGAVTIGGGSNTVAINSSALDISTTGAVSGATTIAASGKVTLSSATPLDLTGTITKGINFASCTPSFTDDDNAWISMGSWNDAIAITGQSSHFVPLQINITSGTSVAKDFAAARFKTQTAAANTLTAFQNTELRSTISHDVGGHTNLGVSTNVASATSCTGDFLAGYFNIQGSGNITCSNHVNVLEATNTHTGTGVVNVAHFTNNATGAGATNILKVENIIGTTTNGINITRTAGTLTNGINLSGTMTREIVMQNAEYLDNATNGVINTGNAQLQSATYNFATAAMVTGSGDSIAINFTPDLSVTTGTEITFIAEAANTTTVRIDVDGTVKDAYEEVGAAPNAMEANDIRSGAVVRLVYDGTRWVQISPSGN